MSCWNYIQQRKHKPCLRFLWLEGFPYLFLILCVCYTYRGSWLERGSLLQFDVLWRFTPQISFLPWETRTLIECSVSIGKICLKKKEIPPHKISSGAATIRASGHRITRTTCDAPRRRWAVGQCFGTCRRCQARGWGGTIGPTNMQKRTWVWICCQRLRLRWGWRNGVIMLVDRLCSSAHQIRNRSMFATLLTMSKLVV